MNGFAELDLGGQVDVIANLDWFIRRKRLPGKISRFTGDAAGSPGFAPGWRRPLDDDIRLAGGTGKSAEGPVASTSSPRRIPRR